MSEKRIQFSNIVQNQLPVYTQDEFPLVSDFLKSYYEGQEYQGGPIDLAQNIDEYIKIDNLTNLTGHVGLKTDITLDDDTIEVDMVNYPAGTDGFPKSYGLLKIDDEIITYTGITTTAFTGCVRGFCGITSYKEQTNPDVLVFNSSTSEGHIAGSEVKNLSSLFLNEFLLKTKNQLLPGLENRNLSSNLNQNVFIKQAKDFYLSKGTDRSFEILFKALYEEDVRIVKPRDYLFTPSNANYKINNDLVVEVVEGDPTELENSTLFQDKYGDITEKAYAPVTQVEPINVGAGKTFYKLSFDAGYDRDVRVDGSIYGTFVVHSKTKVIGGVSLGSTTFDVDSTVGFPESGELKVVYADATSGIVSYTSKSINQFFGCSNIIADIPDATNVGVNTYTYGYSNIEPTEVIKVNITSVLNSLDYPDNTNNFSINETAKIKTLGDNDTSFKAKGWFYNIAPLFKVKKLEVIDPSDNTYLVTFDVDHTFRIGDKADLIDNAGNVKPTSTVIDVDGAKQITIKGQGLLDLTYQFTIRRNILKTQSTTFPQASLYSTNVQNVYTSGGKYLVASSSIPTYNSQPLNLTPQTVTFSGTFIGEELQLQTSGDHGFYTGDAVYYYPQRVSESYYGADGALYSKETIKSSLFSTDLGTINAGDTTANEGLYFVQRVNSLIIKIAKSRTNLSNSNFIKLDTAMTVSDNKFTPYKFKLKTLESQNIFREIDLPSNDGNYYKTTPGFTGILINGVEILNYKSHDSIHYGKINSIEVISGGDEYDVINPPNLNITDNVGTGATGSVAVSGSIKEIRIIDPGFDYEEVPEVNISGGNGDGAKASVNTKLITHKVNFDAMVGGSVNLTSNVIGFSTYHKFRNAERVIYNSNGQKGVSGLSTDSEYYASIITNSSIKLHLTRQDAIVGVNTISLIDHGIGRQTLESYDKKMVVEGINIVSGGSGYSNRKKTIDPVGINTSIDTLTLENHAYNSGEIVKYTAAGTAVGGLTSGSNYYVTKVSDDKFKLSVIGSNDDQKTFFYDTKQYVDLTSVGIGTHIFNYEDISITLSGKIGISTVGFDANPNDIFGATIQPIVRGSVTSINLSDQGNNYGDSEIINFNREPNVNLSAGQNAQLQAVVNNGQISEVLIQNTGSNYNSPPDIIISGSGTGAVLTPIIENNKIKEIKVIEGGIGYNLENTTITISVPGNGSQFRALIQEWRINLFERYLKQFTGDDGFIAHEFTENRGLQFSHLYAPRKLRESVFGRNQSGDILYGKTDLQLSNGTEIQSTDHSPIIGWAYDGNPIYGPYGYTTKSGGAITQMRSGYTLELQNGRPSTGLYPEGFFVEDYVYKQVNDDAVLDENNGRFCFTPEFPKGTYAYFAAINDGPADSSENFDGYKRPVFPYLIGNGYKSTPNKFNYNVYSNQKDYNLNKSSWLRNTQPYNLIETTEVEYKYAYIPNDLKQTVDITSVTPGKIEKVGISSSGDLYKVGDSIDFGSSNTSRNQMAGFGADIEVSEVLGKRVSSISAGSSTITGVELYPSGNGYYGEWDVIASNPHNFKENEIVVIAGLSTTSSGLEGAYKAGITTDAFAMTGIGTTTIAVESAAVTGFVTFFNIGGNLKNIKPNDTLKVGDEKVKVLNVDELFSRIRVIRAQNGTTGTAHTVTAIIKQDPRVVTIDAGIKTTFTAKRNTELYFNPIESVAQGTASGVGIGSTLVFSSPGVGLTELFVPTKSIYFRNHNLETGDELTYSTNSGNGLSVRNDGGGTSSLQNDQKLYAAKISDSLIGIATVRVGLGSTGTFVGIASAFRNSTTLAFTGIGTGVKHSLKTNYKPITGDITRNKVNVSTADSHGLISGNVVDINVNPGVTTSIVVKYNDFNRRLIVDPRTFAAASVNTVTDVININDHRFNTGDKVICSVNTNSSSFNNNGIYYIVKIDNDNFKLSTSYYNSKLLNPPTIGITTADAGSFASVNPHIELYKDSTVEFNVSDASLGYASQGTDYSAFEFNFYTDENFTDLWEKTKDSKVFEVKKTGKIGVDADAKVSLTVNKNIPQNLFYKLDPIFENNLPLVKKEIVVDDEVVSGSQVETFESKFNGKHPIVVAVGSTNEFSYTLKEYPEKTSYSTLTSYIHYSTNSKTAYGPVADFQIRNGGQNYYSLPGINTITSDFGSNAVISVGSSSIGRIKKTKIQNIGYNFPSDTTLRPSVALPQVMKMNSLASIGSIGIASVGKGYAVAPTLLVFDGETKKQVKDIDLQYTLGDSQVKILKNTAGINPVTPIIIPTGNSNGVGISTVGFNTTTKDVTLTLSVGFSTQNSFPFEVNDKVLIENISIGIGSTGKGYNSAEYDYKLFSITAVDKNYGGIGIVTYSLADELSGAEYPGLYNPFNSAAARIIPQKYFPSFSVNLSSNEYLIGETVTSKSKEGYDVSGKVETWDVENEILVVSGTSGFVEGEIIKGESSDTQGIASSISSYKSNLNIDAFSKVENGWETDSGFLNLSQQRLQDNDYYQNFSYALRSAVSFSVWEDVVSSLNHTLGYKKFSDYQLDSTADDSGSMIVGLTTASTEVNPVQDLVGYGNLNCVNDFDLVKENSLIIPSGVVSDEIIFSSRILQDYEESIGNRVLTIDDMSGTFNSHPRSTPFSVVETFSLSEHRAQKYICYIQDKRFYSQRQLMVVDLIHDGSFGYIQQYGRVESVYDLGSFDFMITGSEGQLLFYPTRSKVNDYNVTALSYNLDDNLLGVGTTSVGTSLIDSRSVSVPKADASTTIVSIANTYRSAKVLVEITADSEKTGLYDEFEMIELNVVHDGTEVELLDYAEMTTTLNNANIQGFGTYSAYIDGSNFKVDFHPDSVGIGTTVLVNAIVVAQSNESTTAESAIDLKHARLESRSTNIAASGSPTAHVVGDYSDDYDAAYFVIQISDTSNGEYGIAELLVVDDYDKNDGSGDTFDTNEYAVVTTSGGQSITGLGTFYTGISTNNIVASGGAVGMAATTQLIFTPLPNTATNVKVFMNAFRYQDDAHTNIDFNNSSIQVRSSDYTGTDRDIKRAFNLTHNQNNIFDRTFDGADATIVNLTKDTIEIPNHFFVSGEKIKYVHAGAGSTQAISIASTDGFVGVGTTTKLPGDLFAIKVDDNKIKVTDSAKKALLSVPESVDLTAVGIGASHRFVSVGANSKVLLCLDNIVQSPIVATAVTTTLAKQAYTTDDIIEVTGITSIFGGDLLRMGEEIVKIESIGVGSTNNIRVRRQWMGTNLAGHSTSSLVTKVNGNYNIVENQLNFVEAPYGKIPLSSTTNPPDDRDWTGISTSSSFQGRTFMRSGVPNTVNDTYYKNLVFDDISAKFNGTNKDFDLKSDGNNITGIATENAVILVNDVFQGPILNYTLNENLGITSIQFTGAASSTTDANVTQLPLGGVILSVGSTEGFGYQPLVAAGGTAVVSAGGTILSIGLGNTGSGYRSGVQTVGVSVQGRNVESTSVTSIGTASIAGGHITGVAVTNWTSFYKPRDVQDVTYTNVTGITTITTATPHGLSLGDEVKLSGIAFTCIYDNAAERDIQFVSYNHSNGTMTVTTATPHGLYAGKDVILTGIAMTCGLDAGIGTHYYPRNRDRVYDTAIPITADGTTSTITNAVYSPITGIMTCTVASHGLNNGDKVKLSPNSLSFTCAKDNNETIHTYPRATDPIASQWVEITNKTTNTFRIKVLSVTPSTNTTAHTFVGSTTNGITLNDGKISVNVTAAKGLDQYTHQFVSASTGAVVTGGSYNHHFIGTANKALISGGDYDHTFVSATTGGVTVGVGTTTPTSATYDANTGDMVLTIPGHGAIVGAAVSFAIDAITFSCSMDGNATNHSYPRSSDPIIGMGSTVIKSNTPNTITINVGASKTVTHDVTDASYNPTTGLLDLTIPNHGLMGQTQHTVSFANYDPNTGIMTCTVPGHTFSNGDRIKFNDNSLSFRCAHNGADGAAQIKTYPRSTDPKSGLWLPISGVTTSNFEVQVLDTIPSTNTGIHTFVSAVNNGLNKAGVSVRIPDNALTFTCSMDDNSTKHTYPRSTDPFSNTSISVGSTTDNTIQLYVGKSPEVEYNVSAASYNAATGNLDLTIGAHSLTSGTSIKLAKESLTFKCSKDNYVSEHKYPRAGDPGYNGLKVVGVNSPTKFDVNVGVSTVPTFYKSGGKVQGVIVAPRPSDVAAEGTNVLGIIDNYSFTVNSGVSTSEHFYARGGTVEKPLEVIFDEPLSYTGIPLDYSSDSISGVGSDAIVDIVVGQGSSITDFSIQNTGYGYGIGEILTIPIGGATGIPTTSTYKEFQLTIDEIFTDEFTGWSVGTLQALDTPQDEFDGETRAFQMKLNNDIISIRSAKGSKINVQDVILVFVNDILQVPGKGYTFEGGSIITFTEPPKAGDTCKIIFYKGSGGIDVKSRDIIETVKIGDDLQISYDSSKGQKSWQGEDKRSVLRVDSTDIVTTNPYFGPGNSEDETLVRPVNWCRQTEDMIINDLQVGKDRDLYEPSIFPAATILKTVGIGSTTVYVDNVRPFFDPTNENPNASIRATLQDNITLTSQDNKDGAVVSSSISGGSVSSIAISNGGKGYTSTPSVSVQTPVGFGSTATATATVSEGTVTGVTVSYGGTGYTSAPQVLIDPPTLISETNDVLSYNGDYGTVVGFGTTVVSNIDKLIFDFYIPTDSYFRDSNIVGTAITVSGVSLGDYFVINNSNIGFAQTSIVSRSRDNQIVGTGISFFDNVYQVDSVSIVSVANTNIGITTVGTALTSVARVQARISGISTLNFSSSSIYWDSTNYTFDNQNSDLGGGANTGAGYTGGFINRPYLGDYSWGRIELQGRSELNAYPFYGNGGVIGINTSSLVTRTNKLRADKYDT